VVAAYDTSSVDAVERTEYWVDVISELFVPLAFRTSEPASFHGSLRAGSIGPIHLCWVEASAHTVERTQKLAANTEGSIYKLSMMAAGEGLIVQDKREAVLGPGDFAIYDCSRPYTMVGHDDFRMLVCMLPRDIVGISPDRLSRITATRMPGRSGIAWAMAPFLTRIAVLATRDETLPDEPQVVQSVIELVESLCGSVISSDRARAVPPRSQLMLQIRAYVDAHLGDPQLNPAQIANAHYISKRYLYKILESEETTVSRWIRDRRLERCRADLADPARRDETVTSIGARWGITDSGHLSRIFHETFGCTPTDYRAEMLESAQAH
jgi:AraC-like DNA-binding protein